MKEPKSWRVVESSVIVDYRFLHVREDLLEHPDDRRRFNCLYLKGPTDAVATVALTNDGCVLLIRQYRHPVGRVIYDLPAGSREAGESPQQAAARELEEETGYRAAQWQKMTYFNQFPGAMRVGTHIFLAQELTSGDQNLDRYEDLEVVKMPFYDALSLVTRGQVIDGSMIVGLLMAAQKGFAPK